MDAAAYLALLAKAKLVFESEGTFLSFPVLSQLTYDVEDLQFNGAAPAGQRLEDLSEFSRVTNRVQRGVVAAIDGDEYVWDVYDDILSNAELAEPELSEAQEKEYAAALELLYAETADGLRQDSPVLTAYKSFRDAHINALEQYKQHQVTADMSDDPAVTAQWTSDEPALRKTLDDIEVSWAASGRRAEVEAAQQVERACNAKAPALRWDEWRKAFVGDLDLATDTNQIRFATTLFSPHDVFDGDGWLRFTLSSDEIVALGEQAPEELREILGQVDTASDIESLSFEYRSVALDRSWLERSVFDSRVWRLGPEGGELSDGAEPPQGRCPGYAVALVFARRVTLKWKSPPPTDGPGADPGRLLILRPDLLQRLRLPVRPELPVRTPLSTRVPLAVRTEAIGRPVRPMPAAASVRLATSPLERIRVRPSSRVLTELLVQEPVLVPEPVPETEPGHPEEAPTDDITILAFVCRRLPRCPDPDPGLHWD
jgi:hypothetical protein